MFQVAISCAVIVMAQPIATGGDAKNPATWAEFYQSAANRYQVTYADGGQRLERNERPVFNWVSIDDFHGAVFAWTKNGRPTLVATIFSFPLQNSKQRLAVHEFASFSEINMVVDASDGKQWKPPPLQQLQRVPDAAPPVGTASTLKLQCRRLAKEFSANMNRRGEPWELRLLPTPLVEYHHPSADILGGGLFAFVGYSTDPEILLLLEARQSSDGPAWCFHPVRFSDKSLYLKFQDRPVWESLRQGHGSDGPDSDDPHYRVLLSERLPQQLVEQLSASSAKK
jgi:hypothetical protein